MRLLIFYEFFHYLKRKYIIYHFFVKNIILNKNNRYIQIIISKKGYTHKLFFTKLYHKKSI